MSNPGSSTPGQVTHYAFSQEAPRYAMAVASSPYDALYRVQAYPVRSVCLCFFFIPTGTPVHTPVYTPIHTPVYTHLYTHPYTHLYTHPYTHLYTHPYTHLCTHMYTHKAHACMHTLTFLQIYMHRRTHNSNNNNNRNNNVQNNLWKITLTCMHDTCTHTQTHTNKHTAGCDFSKLPDTLHAHVGDLSRAIGSTTGVFVWDLRNSLIGLPKNGLLLVGVFSCWVRSGPLSLHYTGMTLYKEWKLYSVFV